MAFISMRFYILLIMVLFLYYAVPLKYRWYILLVGSIVFYVVFGGVKPLFILGLVVAASYASAIILSEHKTRILLVICICVTLLPLILAKHTLTVSIVPLGISFFSLQAVSYIVDVYRDKIRAQKNILRYLLFILFFPQVAQGPIPRYGQLEIQLYEGHRFDERIMAKGQQLIVWGFFLKFMIADKAAVVVDTIYENWRAYVGFYVLIAGILYSIQLYADFMAYVCMARGVAGLFGIELADNFKHPYKAASVKDFWQRWHISFSSWLRDYIYIPLGGNRKGKYRKYINLTITFVISGIWHGKGIKYVFWGLMHAFYQIVAEILDPIRKVVYRTFRIEQESYCEKIVKKTGTFFWIMLAWIVFRADGLLMGIKMILHMFQSFNVWILFDDSLLTLGLDGKDWIVLAASVAVLWGVEHIQERVCVRDLILEQHIVIRWTIYIAAVLTVWIFGTYGFGYTAQDFIYGGF